MTTPSDSNAEQEAAMAEMNLLLDQSRPKHIGTGITSGIGYILAGAVGACGIAVLSPPIAAKAGRDEGGIIGGVMGGLLGVVVGSVNAVNVAGGGIVSGIGQVARGVAGTPAAITAPRQGKWWNDAEGHWILTDLDHEKRWLLTFPDDDSDVLLSKEPDPILDRGVKDAYYYDILGVDTGASASTIKRQYYIQARKYSPDRAGHAPEALEKFREIGNAYCILSDEDMRAKYDTLGLNFLDDDDEVVTPLVDPTVLYRVLYGSEKFDPYVGRLAAATAASVGDSPSISLVEARLLQKRRVTRLAIQLADRLKDYMMDPMIARANWMAEADFLVKASYGYELLHVVGKMYVICAIQFLGSLESGIGLPSIANWSKKQFETMKHGTRTEGAKMAALAGDMNKLAVDSAVKDMRIGSMTEDEQKEAEKTLQTTVGDQFLHYMWKTTVVDITQTIHEAAQMVLHDQAVLASQRRKRGEALQLLGEIFLAQPALEGPNFDKDGQQSYEEVAFSAMLETIVRKDKSAHFARSEHEYEEEREF